MKTIEELSKVITELSISDKHCYCIRWYCNDYYKGCIQLTKLDLKDLNNLSVNDVMIFTGYPDLYSRYSKFESHRITKITKTRIYFEDDDYINLDNYELNISDYRGYHKYELKYISGEIYKVELTKLGTETALKELNDERISDLNELNRRNKPIIITTGMWEDVLSRLNELESN